MVSHHDIVYVPKSIFYIYYEFLYYLMMMFGATETPEGHISRSIIALTYHEYRNKQLILVDKINECLNHIYF